MNEDGVITGSYYDVNNTAHGFVRSRRGKITTFDAPGIVNGTFPVSINEEGTIVGYYYDAAFNIRALYGIKAAP